MNFKLYPTKVIINDNFEQVAKWVVQPHECYSHISIRKRERLIDWKKKR